VSVTLVFMLDSLRPALPVAVLVVALAWLIPACGGSGSTSSGANGDSGAGTHDSAATDSTSPGDSSATDSSSGGDSGSADSALPTSDTGNEDAAPDSEAADSATDTGSPAEDSGASDGASTDTGVLDTGLMDGTPSDAPVSISVTVSGLAAGDSVVLQDNGGPSLTVSMNGSTTVQAAVAPGTAYAITVKTQPASPPQTCTVSNGVGTAEASVANISVACVTQTFAIGGTLSGLANGATVVLQDNAGDNLSLTASGSFTFATPVTSGSSYAVTVLTQPANQQCTVTQGTGTVGAVPVTSVVVTCTTPTVTVGGMLTGLEAGNSVVLQDNGGNNLTLTSNGMFMFTTPVADGTMYTVTVSTQPLPQAQTCTVSAGTGTIGSTNVTGVLVNCAPGTVTLGGTLSGLAPTDVLALSNGGGADSILTTNGPFVLSTPVTANTAYAVTVHGQPLGESCAVTNGSGTAGTTNITNIVVTCASLLSGTVTGLPAGETMTVQANGTSTNVSGSSTSSTAFSLTSALVTGQAYTITVGASPSSPINVNCAVTANGTGTTGTAAATSIGITCTPASCADLLAETPAATSGIYSIYPRAAAAPFQGYCDMVTDGGGWLLVGRSQPGGWNPGCASTDGGNNFGWQTSRGAVTDDTQAYSLGVVTAGVTNFSELLFGSYSTGKVWGSRIFVQTLPAAWFTTYATTDVPFAARPTEVSVPACVPLASSPDNSNPAATGGMFLRGGYTSATYGFQLRDVPGGGFGLMASGWATCYGEDSYCYAGGINGSQGMMMVR